ncbi:hypothetical protein [Thiohalophilus thiocyanatoxydans]|uniref:Uncharacterized protein n=1 Tax=Thiohalophilus thiocyanatoxydans TaxID=381308 RepID=A0A4R8J1E7_9GAMM|nr:hypothetical protein [Thiohalophilus thiocyanatoxydans]TDY03643.1 hypothetical protein EDC23_0012 [Thiohalophilus thiocyanatoxydans]
MNASMKDGNSNQKDYVVDTTPIPLLQEILSRGKVWEDLSTQYGVTNPDPPWKITLETTCDLLAADSCVKPYEEVDTDTCALPSLERRTEEDELSETIYEDVPFPERQLLALAHSMIKRGLLEENELAGRMAELEKRFKSA